MREIILNRGAAMVDDSDFEWLNQFTWREWRPPKSKTSYAVTGKYPVLMHRMIFGLEIGDPTRIDHRDWNGLNNQRYNLRPATTAQNVANNRRVLPPSGYRGVTWDKSKSKWSAAISHNGRSIHLGRFDDPVMAAIAWNNKCAELRGEFAVLNEIHFSGMMS